eukprot:SAG31_NODE_3101_length_4673_cov_7.286839_1_plen_56_part_00
MAVHDPMRLLLPLVAIAAQSVTAQYGPDFGKCTCATFCDGSCDIDDTGMLQPFMK